MRREQNDPSGLPQPPPPCGPGKPGKPPAAPRRPQDEAENQPNTGVPVAEERTRDDPAEQAPLRRRRRG